jgi:hypothetical protein
VSLFLTPIVVKHTVLVSEVGMQKSESRTSANFYKSLPFSDSKQY